MAERQLDILENRIEELETLVFGNADKDSLYPKVECPGTKCIDSLANIQSKVQNAVNGKRRITQTYERLSELEKYLDPVYSDQLTLPESSKTEIILAEEEFIRDQALKLEEIQNLSQFISSEHLKGVPSQTSKLQDLFQIQLKQQDRTGEISSEAEQLLSAYNNIVNLLSKQFVQWNELVTQLEARTKSKK